MASIRSLLIGICVTIATQFGAVEISNFNYRQFTNSFERNLLIDADLFGQNLRSNPKWNFCNSSTNNTPNHPSIHRSALLYQWKGRNIFLAENLSVSLCVYVSFKMFYFAPIGKDGKNEKCLQDFFHSAIEMRMMSE